MSLKHEPASEPLHIYVKKLFSDSGVGWIQVRNAEFRRQHALLVQQAIEISRAHSLALSLARSFSLSSSLTLSPPPALSLALSQVRNAEFRRQHAALVQQASEMGVQRKRGNPRTLIKTKKTKPGTKTQNSNPRTLDKTQTKNPKSATLPPKF